MILLPPADPIRFSTSWALTAKTYAAFRALISLYILTSILTILAWDSHNSPVEVARYWSYFTNITFISLGFYHAFAAYHSLSYWRTGTPALARWPGVLGKLHSLFYSTIVVFPFLVTIVFWSLLYTSLPTPFTLWSNLSEHALNSVFALLEITFARTEPMPWIHLAYLVVLLAMYLGVVFITVDTEHFYVYGFLDYHRPGGRGRVAAYIFGVLLLVVVLFVVVRYLIRLRVWLTETRVGRERRLETRESLREETQEVKV
ncbi:hypothetical protein BT63DRAFT_419732 [Microthyrium microscopicum]|uniref:FAR-17a/AIG1-like protein n=1 Tax=Microthyrium microscopicum TaxID=703497 RepID=A0A6A6UQ70_9PEZI|nr:hypothetical protein BT63DRAFT_419732 [Microthyrium microscopicum]